MSDEGDDDNNEPADVIDTTATASSTTTTSSTMGVIDLLKQDLVNCCTRTPNKPSLDEIRTLVDELESKAEQMGIGQAAAISGLLSGTWELLYAPEDATRSSPFFWAFRQAFPENADQIFSITDAIPAPIKEIGPATQEIQYNSGSSAASTSQEGTFVSRVKVATLGGIATSIMTTRATITGIDGLDGIRLQIDTTKPEDSTVLTTLFGPFADTLQQSTPPFPSGDALEKVAPGSSEVIMRTTFCDDGIRVSRDDRRMNEVYVWRRKAFVGMEPL